MTSGVNKVDALKKCPKGMDNNMKSVEFREMGIMNILDYTAIIL